MQLQLGTAALLLILLHLGSGSLATGRSCELLSVQGDLNAHHTQNIVGSTSHKGIKLRVFEAHDAQFTEPGLFMGRFCSTLWFNRLYQKHQLTVPLSIDGSALNQSSNFFSKVQEVSINELNVHVEDEVLSARKEIFAVHVNLLKQADKAELQILCNSLDGCRQLRVELDGNLLEFLLSMKFSATGKAGNIPVRFSDVKLGFVASLDCPKDRWIVFQRRVDATLSFAQNWDTYANGFGSPDSNSNYWMGLEQLSLETGRKFINCQMRIETRGIDGTDYWGEWQSFKVLSADKHYELNLDKRVNGTVFDDFQAYHNLKKFSTYDKVFGGASSATIHCPEMYSNGGWWFTDCFKTYLNGKFLSAKNSDSTSGLWSKVNDKGYVQMVRSQMMFKCT